MPFNGLIRTALAVLSVCVLGPWRFWRRRKLATAQADVAPGPSAQMVAILYDDTFQLLAHGKSSIQSFA